jgi:hypothetical protein
MAQRISDEAFIEQVRSREQQRGAMASLAVILGLVVLGMAWFITSTALRYVMVPGLLPTAGGGSPDIILTVEKMSYWWGVAVGFCTALAWLLAVYLIFKGAAHRTQGRFHPCPADTPHGGAEGLLLLCLRT